MSIDKSESYAINFEIAEPKHYTRIPNIIDHLTYSVQIDGEKVTKRLSVYAKELYRVFRMIASDNGKSWNSTCSLAEKVGCSVGMIVKAKAELMQKFDQLAGNSLIIEKKTQLNKKNTYDKSFATHLCTHTIVNVWPWNNAFMATLKTQNQYGNTNSTHSCGESVPLGTHSCGESNKIPSQLDPFVVVVGETPSLEKEREKAQESKKQTDSPLKPPNSFSKDDLYFMSNKSRKDWNAFEIEASWIIYSKSDPACISDPFAYIEGIIKKTRIKEAIKKEKELEKFKNKKKQGTEKCNPQETTQKNTPNTCNAFIAESDMSESPLAKFARQNGLK